MILPSSFEAYTQQLMGTQLYDKFITGLNSQQPTSIRINPFKIRQLLPSQTKPATQGQPKANATTTSSTPDDTKATDTTLAEDTAMSTLLVEGARRVPWCQWGWYLPTRPSFTFDPLLHAGLYYVQESSSMFICEVVRQLIHTPVLMLDLCAAPGGKSTALRTALPKGSMLIANEPVKVRASILTENVMKFGHADMMVTNNYPRDFQKAGVQFDAILADVPCSGEGMFRKDAEAIKEWSPDNVEHCWQLQRSIVEDIWPCLRPGGLLIYSTCTLNAHEDEENVAWIAQHLGADVVALDINKDWSITGALTGHQPVCRFIPGLTPGEGLFMAVLRKHGESSPIKWNNSAKRSKDKPQRIDSITQELANKSSHKHFYKSFNKNGKTFNKNAGQSAIKAVSTQMQGCAQWLHGDFDLTTDNDLIRAIPTNWSALYQQLKASLHILHAGIEIGTIKGKDIVPTASLALSVNLNLSAFPQAELSETDCISYLRHEAVALSSDIPRGFVLITYRHQPLGFVKNLGNRANNLYPAEWRIRSSHTETATSEVFNRL